MARQRDDSGRDMPPSWRCFEVVNTTITMICGLAAKGTRKRKGETMMGIERFLPQRGYVQRPRVSEEQPWVTRDRSPNPERVLRRASPSTRTGLHGIEVNRDVGLDVELAASGKSDDCS